MSYILDALRRADAERERGAVPSLHAQQYASLPDDDEARRGPKPMVWVVIGLAAALIAALAWNFFGHETPRPLATAKAPDAGAPAQTAPAQATPPVGGSAAAIANATSGAASAAAADAPKPVRKVRRPPPAAASGLAPAPLDGARTAAPPGARGGADIPVGIRPGDAGAPRSVDPAAPALARASEGAGDGRIYALRDLPEEIRRTLPSVAVSGSTYSNDRASRMLMINGQIFHEGDVVSNGLVLQQIKPRGAVFSFKGFRYETGF